MQLYIVNPQPLSFYNPQFELNALFPFRPHPVFISLFLWRFLGGLRVNRTSQGRRGGWIRLSL